MGGFREEGVGLVGERKNKKGVLLNAPTQSHGAALDFRGGAVGLWCGGGYVDLEVAQ